MMWWNTTLEERSYLCFINANVDRYEKQVLFYTYPFVIAVGAVECRMATPGNELYPPYL